MSVSTYPQPTSCLNCGHPLQATDNFCPHCGQENKPAKLTLRILLSDFLNNYIAFDSKLGRSIFPFLFKPGWLTKRFNQGERVSYVHPLRLYLIISVLFFFFLSGYLSYEMEVESVNKMMVDKEMPGKLSEQAVYLGDSTQLDASDSLTLAKIDSLTSGSGIQQKVDEWKLISDPSLSDEEIFQQLEIGQDDKLTRTSVRQLRKVARRDLSVFIPYIVKNLPLMMFLLLPFFALYLFLLFHKQDAYYIGHLIHSLHIHAFAFFVLLLSLLSSWLFGKEFALLVFLLITVYAFLSIKKVYQQAWLRTFFKFNLLGFLYFTTLLIGIVIEITLSFYLF